MNKSVFVIEPDDSCRMFIRRSLEAAGFAISGEAAGASEGLHLLFSSDVLPSLIVIEVSMRYMTGYDTARAIRHLRPDACIIFMSSSELDEMRGRAFGARGMVWKSPAMVDFAAELVRICTLVATDGSAAVSAQSRREAEEVY